MAYGSAEYAALPYGDQSNNYPHPTFLTDAIVQETFTDNLSVDGIIATVTAQSVIFNGYLINGVYYITERTTHDSAPTRQMVEYKIARRDGDKLVSSWWSKKEIEITGYIQISNQSDYEYLEDQLKQLLAMPQSNLDIYFRGSTRRYVATASEVSVNRDSDNIDWAPFTIKFLVPDGKGYDTNYQQTTYPKINTVYAGSAILNDGLANNGTAYGLPVFTLTVHSQTSMSQVILTVGTSQLTITRTFSNGDVLTIDYNTFIVSIGGTPIDFSGTFADWPPGSTPFSLEIVASSIDATLTSVITPSYL